MSAKQAYKVKYETYDKKDGHRVGGNIVVVHAESETNAIAEIKKRYLSLRVEVVSVIPQ